MDDDEVYCEEDMDDGLEWYEREAEYDPSEDLYYEEEITTVKRVERRGRPKKQINEVRRDNIRVRLTYHEMEKLRDLTRKYKVNKSEILRAGIHALNTDNFRVTENHVEELLNEIHNGK